jgi:kynurenine formamidase
MATKETKGWYDISVPLKQGMTYFPTDPVPPRIYRYHDRAMG